MKVVVEVAVNVKIAPHFAIPQKLLNFGVETKNINYITTNTMSERNQKLKWVDAIIIALGSNNSKMHYDAICNYIQENKLYDTRGKTPARTINRTIHVHKDLFDDMGNGVFGLNLDGEKKYNELLKLDPQGTKTVKNNKLIVKVNVEPYKTILETNHNIIFHGAPGTGKTYLAQEIAKTMGATKENKQFQMVQFHPSYDYTDFVEGLRPTGTTKNGNIIFSRKDGVFKKFCKKAVNNHDTKKYIFLIDEINRGDLSKIFGELFFSIDPCYRGGKGKINTQYQNMLEGSGDVFESGFYVPDNVYIIGTMNDIDRSVESMDFAMRRRFQFIEVTAESRAEGMGLVEKDADGNITKPTEAYQRMTSLNNCISSKAEEGGIGLSSAYHIGGSYFLKKVGDKSELITEKQDFDNLWEYRLKGLLREYLRGDEECEIERKLNLLKEAYNNPPKQ